MQVRNIKAWVLTACVCLFGALLSGQRDAFAATAETNAEKNAVVAPDVATPVAIPAKLDNVTCLSCHDGKNSKPEAAGADGSRRPLRAINPDKFGKSVHSTLQCVACHKDINDSGVPHQKVAVAKPNCIQCHTELWETAQKENLSQEKARLGIVVKNIEAYKNSFHAKPSSEDKSRPNAICDDCHNTHEFNIPPRGTTRRAEWHLTVPSVCGDKCHTGELEEYSGSVHGKEVLGKHNLKAAVCADCHTAHDIGNTSTDAAKLAITANCGNCHKDNNKSFKATYHGQVSTLGYAYAAKCYDCHGSHGILRVNDPNSMVSKNNRLKTCQQCHNGKKDVPLATAGFTSFSPHGTSNNFERYPEIWLISKFMIALLLGVFTFFWAHSILWWYREYKDGEEEKSRPHVIAAALPEDTETYVRRFGPMWRLAHLCFAISVMMLVLTGMTAFYAETPWAAFFAKLLGGPKNAGIVHRISAAVMLGIFFIHLIVVVKNIVFNWKNFQFFGPNSLVPRWEDLTGVIGMFKWFFGQGPRPTFDRWTYWEKFDYWAVFWGMAIIGGSGMALAFPHVVASVFPGWVFNVAMVIHGEEAFLAAVFLFTVHFFNNHFRPDKQPAPDIVMFTGAQTLEEFKREHTDQYKRLLASGELKKYLVDAPTARMTKSSKALGLTLIAFGLTLFVLILIGFLGGAGA
jgi:thiosulfate reductase cytochrome b subunit